MCKSRYTSHSASPDYSLRSGHLRHASSHAAEDQARQMSAESLRRSTQGHACESTSDDACVATKDDNQWVDPLFYGSMRIHSSQMPQFTSGADILSELERRVDRKELLHDVLNAPSAVRELFNTVFPNVVESNNVGQIPANPWTYWEANRNNIIIEIDREVTSSTSGESVAVEAPKDVYIGGPAALFAAAIQAQSSESSTVMYGHDGQRGISNWKGSASYFHIRDSLPVYYWPDNHGAYVVYVTLKHAIQRRLNPEKYKTQIKTTPNWNKLRVNYSSIFAEPAIMWLFIKNQLNAVKDVGLHVKGLDACVPKNKQACYMTCAHAHAAHEILEGLDTPRPVIMRSNTHTRAIMVRIKPYISRVFDKLKSVAGSIVERRELSPEELKARGFDPDVAGKVVEFPLDGYFPPYVDRMFEDMIREGGGTVQSQMRLKKILVRPMSGTQDVTVSRVIWEDAVSGVQQTLPVRSLYTSLGPSMKKLTLNHLSEYPISTHVADIVRNKVGLTIDEEVIAPTIGALVRRIFGAMKPANLIHRMMWASGMTSVILIKVDRSIVPETSFHRFRDYTDFHNLHVVRLAEKQVEAGNKSYQMFVIQATGGGHFPIKDTHPETALNILKANVIPVLGLEDPGIEYEIMHCRSCARGCTAQNVFRVTAPAENMVSMYGIGGIGITTMVSNGLLMHAVMAARQKLGSGQINPREFKQILKESKFSEIAHWKGRNPFSWNYAKYVDYASDPREVARRLGISRHTVPQKYKTPLKTDEAPLPLIQQRRLMSSTTILQPLQCTRVLNLLRRISS